MKVHTFVLLFGFEKTLCVCVCSCRFWVGYQYVITNQNHSIEGRWEVAYKGEALAPVCALFTLSSKWSRYNGPLAIRINIFA